MHPLRNNKGFTLVETLAVIAILAIVSMLSIVLVTSATKQQIEQSTHNQDIKELSYALKVITKDFRKSDDLREIVDETAEETTAFYIFTLDEVEIATYKLENHQIIRSTSTGQEVLAINVEEFEIRGDTIAIVNRDGQKATTNITIRRGRQ